MTKHEMNEDELQYLNSLTKITPSEQVVDDLFEHRSFVRIDKFFFTSDNKLEKVRLSLDKKHVMGSKDIKYVMDNGALVAFIPAHTKPKFKSPSEVFYEAFG